jgi:glutamate synthase (NADPH/NADH) large chain
MSSHPTSLTEQDALAQQGLYTPAHEHDACGVGFVAHIKGQKAHGIVEQGLKILENLDHRGAVGADKLMGDGAGILIQIPDDFYRAEMARTARACHPAPARRVRRGHDLPAQGTRQPPGLRAGTGARRQGRRPGAAGLARRAGGPRMPMSPTVRAKEPVIRQIFIGRGTDVIVPDALERKLYVIRKTASAAIQALKLTHSREYYVPSMSCRTVIYKGLLLADQVGVYYKDLADPRVVSAMALVHQRFSAPTPSPSGRWPTPTAWWRTTARSTPSRATSTGCAPAKA